MSSTAPFSFLHPTRAQLGPHPSNPASQAKWNSRASRKNRYPEQDVKIHLGTSRKRKHEEEKGGKAHNANLRVRHEASQLKVHLAWDISFWIAVVFVLGSVAWVINGFLLYLPLLNAGKAHPDQSAAWGFVGGTLFELGGYLMYVESLNTGHEQLFGPELERLFQHEKANSPDRFRWWGLGSWRDLGYLASSIQFFAATIFWVSTLTGLPGVIPGFPDTSSTAITDIFFWTPQVIGGTGFVISSALLMLEVQKTFWKPNLTSLGWHIGLWNLIGAFGFLICGAFGYGSLGATWVNYQSVLSTFWGSWAFLIGSMIQLWETLWREPS